MRRLEVSGQGGGALLFPFPKELEHILEEDFDFDRDPRSLCRYVDALTCKSCDTCRLILQNLSVFLSCDGPYLPQSPHACPACSGSCYGPLQFDIDGVPSAPLAYLAPKFGAPLIGRLCSACGQIWMSLYPDDYEARRELASRFASSGACSRCAVGQLRETNMDVPYSGLAGLFDATMPTGKYGAPTLVADLLVRVCDACGEALPRIHWH
jgi:hypothetical protein